MKAWKIALMGLLLGFASPALAQIVNPNQPTVPSLGKTAYTGVTVTGTHGSVLAANKVTVYLMLHNPSAQGGNTVYCSFGGTAVAAASGTVSIAPGQYVTWESSYAPLDAIDCIATTTAGASTPLTIGVQ